MEKEYGRELFTRMLMIVGGAMALVFSLLTALIPNLAYVYVSRDARVFYWPLEFLQSLHRYYSIVPLSFRLFFGLLLASFGGFLSLISGVKHDNRFASLSFVGSFLGVLGFLPSILSLQPPFTTGKVVAIGFDVPWVGICLPLIGVSFMLTSSAVRHRGLQLLTLLGIPFLLASWLICPFLIVTNNVSLLISVCSSALANNIIGAFAVLGFMLTLSGSAMGTLKFYAGSKRELFKRLLMIVGGAMALVFGLSTAFIPEIAYVFVHPSGLVEYWYEWIFQRLIYSCPFFSRLTLGLLVVSVGGFLGLVSAVKRSDKLASLGSVGNFLGILGFLISIQSFQPPFTRSEKVAAVLATDIAVPSVGFCLALVGVSFMLTSSAVRHRGLQLLTLLGIPFLLASWLIYPLLIITNNRPLLSYLYWSTSANVLIGTLAVLGFALTLSGSAFGIWKSRADLKRIIHATRKRLAKSILLKFQLTKINDRVKSE